MYLVFLVIVCMLFFFFKQKTAYEMRISDWSSDVCSSDLPNFPLQVPLINSELVSLILPPLPLPSPRRPNFSLRIHRWLLQVTPYLPQPHQQRRLQEIGRASCRERVCQYV